MEVIEKLEDLLGDIYCLNIYDYDRRYGDVVCCGNGNYLDREDVLSLIRKTIECHKIYLEEFKAQCK